MGASELPGVLCRARLQCQAVSCPQVFIRELISNGSDALEKLRHRLMTEGKALPELEIHLQTDSGKGTITIQVVPSGNSRVLFPAALLTGLCPVKSHWKLSSSTVPRPAQRMFCPQLDSGSWGCNLRI